jgi:hypothetical protein
MHRTRPALLGLTLLAALALASPAKADVTLGSTVQPAGSGPNSCPPTHIIGQIADNPLTPYFPPAAGRITQWRVNTTGSTPGQSVVLVVMRGAAPPFTIVAVDPKSVPNPLPPGNVATFTPAAPLPVAAGDKFGLYSSAGFTPCYWGESATIPPASVLGAFPVAGLPAVGQSVPVSDTGAGFTMNLAANFAPPAKKKCKKKKKGKKGAAEAAKKKCKKKKKGKKK